MIEAVGRVVLLAMVLMAPQPAAAGDPSPALAAPDRQAIRAVIEAQLDAFRHDDGAAAFGFASPAIRHQFGDPETFMRMVKSGYTAVYRPRSVHFGTLVDTALGPDQILRLIGPDGDAYTAHYIMQKQPDGRWMINGCFLSRAEEQGV